MHSRKKQLSTILLTCVSVLAVGVSAFAQQAASRPVLASLHPSASSTKSGSASTLVVVAGLNFVRANTTVVIENSPRVTTVINSEALVFELTQADLAQPRTLMVSVVNRTPTAAFKSNSLPFVILP